MGWRAIPVLVAVVPLAACLESTPGYGESDTNDGSAGGSATEATDGVTSTSATGGTTDASGSSGSSGMASASSTTGSGGTSATATSSTGGIVTCVMESFGDHRYMFCTTGRSWEDAQAFCVAEGANLTTIDDAAENEWLFATLRTFGTGSWWMGYNDLTTEGTFEWADGTAPGYDSWEPGEPNDKGPGEDCGELNRFPTDTWNDTRCASALSFICESA